MKLEEIIQALQSNNGAVLQGGTPFSVQELTDFTRQLSVTLPESSQVVLLYSGGLQPDSNGGFVPMEEKGLFAWQAANNIAETTPHIGIVDHTPAMRLLDEKPFKIALDNTAEHFGLDRNEIIFGSYDANNLRNADGIIDDISARFVTENAHKPFAMLTPFARPDSVYGQTRVTSEPSPYQIAQNAPALPQDVLDHLIAENMALEREKEEMQDILLFFEMASAEEILNQDLETVIEGLVEEDMDSEEAVDIWNTFINPT